MGQPGQGRSALPSGVVVEELGGTTCSERAKVQIRALSDPTPHLSHQRRLECVESQI